MTLVWRIVGASVLLMVIVVVAVRGGQRGVVIAVLGFLGVALLLLVFFLMNRARWTLRQQLSSQGVDAADVSFRADGQTSHGVLAWGADGIDIYEISTDRSAAATPRVHLPWIEVAAVQAGAVRNELVIESVNRGAHSVEVVGLLGGALVGASKIFARTLKRLKAAAALHA